MNELIVTLRDNIAVPVVIICTAVILTVVIAMLIVLSRNIHRWFVGLSARLDESQEDIEDMRQASIRIDKNTDALNQRFKSYISQKKNASQKTQKPFDSSHGRKPTHHSHEGSDNFSKTYETKYPSSPRSGNRK